MKRTRVTALMTQMTSSTTAGPPSSHHLIRLSAAVVREMSSLQPNMPHREDMQRGPSSASCRHALAVSIPMNGTVSHMLASIRPATFMSVATDFHRPLNCTNTEVSLMRGQELIYASMPINGALAKIYPNCHW
ncbi:hypothetical protein J4Q44_G00006250 [Coregonus suidteri]|uniref:Uncharacterized protein n=1 Tax=Coregonus suidteri TaxID=861788 RepID=A0AAN8MJK0_9TELE